MIQHITSEEEFNALLMSQKDKYIFVDWYADWCGPCKRISPFIEKLNDNNAELGVKFIKVNVDETGDLSLSRNIKNLPTFDIYKNQQLMGRTIGASEEEIIKLFDKCL